MPRPKPVVPTRPFNIRLSDEVFDQIDAIAREHRVNRSDAIRLAVKAFACGPDPDPVSVPPMKRWVTSAYGE